MKIQLVLLNMMCRLLTVLAVIPILAPVPAWGFHVETLQQELHHITLHQAQQRYPQADIQITIAPFHTAVRDKVCDQFELRVKGNRLFGRVPVMARCTAPQAWTFYASVNIDVALPIVMSQRAISGGELITADMITTRLMSMAQLRAHYLQDPADAVGKVSKRSIRAGQPVYLNQLTSPMAIKKGQRIAIQARIGNAYVSTHGTALQAGRIGDQIAVLNESSKRRIKSWVLSPGTVGTRPPVLSHTAFSAAPAAKGSMGGG